MFRRGRRLFSTASLLLIVVAGLHMLGHFAPPPADPELARLLDDMRAKRLDLGLGFEPSVFDIFESLSLTMSALLVWLGIQNLLVSSGGSEPLLRRTALTSIAGVGALLGVYGYYRVLPPFVTLAVVEAVFVIAFVTNALRP